MTRATVDGNEAAASVAYRLNEVCCIYPITPSSPMAELADEWSSQNRPNVWGSVPVVVEMQSEGGAAGALHGALQSGALATTFTASQGLLLMIPNMYKIAGELTPAVLHVAARSLAAQGLSIFGDHSDVMAVRQTGFALLASASVQDAHDLALVAQAATLATRVPFVHFFDGFRTSHELNTIELLADDDLRALVPAELVRAHRGRALTPEHPFIRGTAQNPDVYFQARETVNPFYAAVPGAVQDAMDGLAARSGRQYHIMDYTGHPEADRVIVVMGSAAQTIAETVTYLCAHGERVGVLQVRLFRPFPAQALLDALPASAGRIAVLDRTKEPGSNGEPLFLDVVAALAEAYSGGERAVLPLVTGGRYGLSSKELTPGMVGGVFAELAREQPRRRFTIGIIDDVSGLSLPYDASLDIEPPGTIRAVFFGLGSDGTVGANKNTIKILGAQENLNAQGYFVYDSKKSGSQTVSHLRFGPQPIRAPYLVRQAGFVGCTYPSGTTAYEKRNVSELVAQWDPDLCIQCGNCSFVCPHSVIRSTYYDESLLAGAPSAFLSAPLDARGLPDTRFTLQVYVEDCTGCELCVQACPVTAPVVAPGEPARKAINLAAREPLVAAERENIAFFETLPVADRSRVDFGTVRGTQFLQPLFEFSGACAGCGETPYIKILSQLFGDRLMVANATGCSSIYGGNLPTTPWTTGPDGRGPAWSNSLFEDNAEFGLGFRPTADRHTELARERLAELPEVVGAELAAEILGAPQLTESELRAQHDRVAELKRRLDGLEHADGLAADLRSVVDHLVRRSVWIVGGDGWAYDIGSGGLDHVLASGRNVNVLVLDTEVYSNTGGQSSKATPLGAVAKFAAAGKTMPKKDLALQAIAYGYVYVARVAMGADPQQTLRAFREAEAYDGPSLIIAYSHCIAHGIEMRDGLGQQYRAVASGYWPLIRYDPMVRTAGGNPFLLDSPRPRIPLTDYTKRELRYRALSNTHPAEAERLGVLAQEAVDQRWDTYEEMATRGAHRFPADARKDR